MVSRDVVDVGFEHFAAYLSCIDHTGDDTPLITMGISIGIACVLSIGVVDFNRIWTSPVDTCHPTDRYSGINMIPC